MKMYQKPDFIKVDLQIEDSFAAYQKICPADYGTWSQWTSDFNCTEDEAANSYVAVWSDRPYQCYSTEFSS